MTGAREDVRTLVHILRPLRTDDPLQWLEQFYAPQAGNYDRFREPMLLGRRELIDAIEWPAGGVWIDLGSGTGRAVLFLESRLSQLSRVCLVDPTSSLAEAARRRCREAAWTNVDVIEADASAVDLPAGCADVVTCMYSLSMMPSWSRTIARAHHLLKPGGVFGAVDYYVSGSDEAAGTTHGWLTRSMWPAWFRRCGVHLGPERLARLQQTFLVERLDSRVAPLPYLPFARVPYYLVIGRRGPRSGPAVARRRVTSLSSRVHERVAPA